MRNKTIINLICSVLVLVINTAINFWLSPFIVENIGVEANGFITLANNFITYANLIVTALNGMASRFITLAYTKKEYSKANLYYNSVFYGNLIIVGVLIIPAIALVVYFENFFDVPIEILTDVKLLFSFVLLGFFVNTGMPNWNVGCYVTNNLNREYIPEAITTIVKALLIFGLLSLLIPKAWYVGLANLIVICIMLCINCFNTHKLTPQLRIKLLNGKPICSFNAIKELVGSGLWSSISNMGNILLSGLDLLICNTLLGATAMGVLSVSKILANLLQQLSTSLTRSFSSELTIDYANGDKEKLKKNILKSMKLTSCIMTIAVAGFITFGKSFFSLWMPSQDAQLLSTLSSLSFLGYVFTSGTQILYNVFNTVNKVKENAIAMICSGIVSISIVFVLIKFTNLGLYAVAGVSTICNLVRNLAFTIPMTAKYLGFKKRTFFPVVCKTVLSSLLIASFSYCILLILPINRWAILIIDAAIVSIFGLILNLVLMLSSNERHYLFNKIKRR